MAGFMTEEQMQSAANLGFADFARLPQEQQDAVNAYLKNPNNQRSTSHSGQDYAGTKYGDRMRGLAGQSASPFATVDHAGIADARALSAQSYMQQRDALAQMQQQAQGGGPSAANAQTAMAQDAAMRGTAGQSGGGLRGALTSNGLNDISAAGGAARGQEIGAAQQGFAGGAGQMRSQSLQDYGQGLQAAHGASALNLSQQDQDLKRRLAYEKLALSGYKMDINGRNQAANAAQGYQFGQQGVSDAYTQGAINSASSGIGEASKAFGTRGPRTNADGSQAKNWNDWET